MSDSPASDHALEQPVGIHPVPSLRASLTTPANWLQLIQFGCVGVSGFVVNVAVFALCLKVFGMHYIPSAIVAWAVAVTNNFLWNRAWTFRHQRDSRHAALQGARFVTVSALALLPNLVLLHLFVQGGMAKLLAQVVAVCLVTPLSFLGNRLWSFR